MEKNSNVIAEKSRTFAVNIVHLYQQLVQEKKEYVLSKQMLKSGTSIGANIHEAIRGPSHADFIAKMCFSLKEASETEYWISLMMDTGYISTEKALPLLKDVEELTKILVSIVKSAEKRKGVKNGT